MWGSGVSGMEFGAGQVSQGSGSTHMTDIKISATDQSETWAWVF